MGIIYKPPNSNIQEFTNTIIPIINKGNRDNKTLFLIGDFNINGPTSDFINDMYAKSMFPLINKPTRITNYSATLIDNIYTNNITTRHKSKPGILYTDTSDHLPIYHCLGTNKPDEKETYIIKRIITEHTKNNFLKKIAEVSWKNIL